MTGFLASVATPGEMEAVRTGGADIVDLKDPSKGALGAWELAALDAAVARWRGWGPEAPELSATIGDQPMRPEIVLAAAERVAATGVPLVKLGLSGGGALACLDALRPLAQRTRLIAVFFADRGVDLALVEAAADAGFAGVMVDTADKAAGGLRRHMGDAALAGFVAAARGRNLLTGLAGSLALADVVPLARLAPDYLGFRGALCEGGRTGRLDADAVAAVRDAVKGRRAAA